MFDTIDQDRQCPQCGYVAPAKNGPTPNAFFRPWHLAHGRLAVKAYVESLGQEASEWLLALYVDQELQLLAVDTVARGGISSCEVPFWKLIDRGHALKAAAFILAHNHPSGDPTPSRRDIQTTERLASVSRDLDIPLLDHLIVAGDEIKSIKQWYDWSDDHPYLGLV